MGKNLKQALYWYKKTAAHGNATAKIQSEKIQREFDNHLNTGDSVSVSRKNYETDIDWCCVKTAEGVEGWVYGKYTSFRAQII